METGFTDNMIQWGQQANRYITECGLAGPEVVRTQAGLLARELVDSSPPKDRKRSAARIESRVQGAFQSLGNANTENDYSGYDGTKAGNGDVRWYAFTPGAVYGVAREVDFTSATVDQLYKLYYGTTLTKQGRRYLGKRGKQALYLWQKITTKAATVKALVKQIQGHLGRLKAGWMVSWDFLGRPGKAPAQWIATHFEKGRARGYYLDELQIPGNPAFTIVNFAKGATAIEKQGILSNALAKRARMMAADIAFAFAHPDQWKARMAAHKAAA